MVNMSSDVRISASLAVVPLVPAVGEPGLGGIAVEEEEDELAEGRVGVAAGEELGDALEGDEPGKGLDNKEEIRQRLRTFHVV
jgi:hypothetical protein